MAQMVYKVVVHSMALHFIRTMGCNHSIQSFSRFIILAHKISSIDLELTLQFHPTTKIDNAKLDLAFRRRMTYEIIE